MVCRHIDYIFAKVWALCLQLDTLKVNCFLPKKLSTWKQVSSVNYMESFPKCNCSKLFAEQLSRSQLRFIGVSNLAVFPQSILTAEKFSSLFMQFFITQSHLCNTIKTFFHICQNVCFILFQSLHLYDQWSQTFLHPLKTFSKPYWFKILL